MIVRVFRAKVIPGAEEKFAHKLKESSVGVLEGRDGMLGYFAGRPTSVTPDEFVMISLWRDEASVRALAGEDWGKAVMPDEEYAPILREFFTHHYEVIAHHVA